MKGMMFKQWKSLVMISGIGLCLILFGCALPDRGMAGVAGSNQTIGSERAIGTSSTNILAGTPIGSYPYGAAAGRFDQWPYLVSEYARWRDTYVTANGAGGEGFLRVQRDAASNYDTVSEGQAYGMLLAVYFNDRYTFDRLYNYAANHFVWIDSSIRVNLMHWMINAQNRNISEFGIEVPSGGGKGGYIFLKLDTALTANPTYVEAYSNDVYPNRDNPDPGYVMCASNGRGESSASDADFDMAAALCFATKKWNAYHNEAARMISDLLVRDQYNGFIKNGTGWGSQKGWNPSYFTPAWWRLYKSYINKNPSLFSDPAGKAAQCDLVISTMYAEMKKIFATSGVKLPPDWVDTSGSAIKKSVISDRKYFLDKNGDGVITPADYNKTRLSISDGYGAMSYNFYYDAVRTPWRLAVDYSWNGAAQAYSMVRKMHDFFKGQMLLLLDGYSMTGGKWKWEDRDGFNLAVGGSSGNCTTFTAMCFSTGLASNLNTYPKTCYDMIKSRNDYGKSPYHYYGNNLRLLSLLYMAGSFTNIFDCEIALRSMSNNRYVATFDRAGQLLAASDSINVYSTFDLIDLGNNQIALRSAVEKRYICADMSLANPPGLYVNRDAIGEWETFDVTVIDSNKIALKSHANGRFVCADHEISSAGPLFANRDAIGSWETFEVIKVQ